MTSNANVFFRDGAQRWGTVCFRMTADYLVKILEINVILDSKWNQLDIEGAGVPFRPCLDCLYWRGGKRKH